MKNLKKLSLGELVKLKENVEIELERRKTEETAVVWTEGLAEKSEGTVQQQERAEFYLG